MSKIKDFLRNAQRWSSITVLYKRRLRVSATPDFQTLRRAWLMICLMYIRNKLSQKIVKKYSQFTTLKSLLNQRSNTYIVEFSYPQKRLFKRKNFWFDLAKQSLEFQLWRWLAETGEKAGCIKKWIKYLLWFLKQGKRNLTNNLFTVTIY